MMVTVHGFKGSAQPLTAEVASLIEKQTPALRSQIRGVQGLIFVHGVHLGSVFIRKASASSGPIQNLELNWQLLGKMSIFNDDFGFSIRSLSLTLNVEPVNGYETLIVLKCNISISPGTPNPSPFCKGGLRPALPVPRPGRDREVRLGGNMS